MGEVRALAVLVRAFAHGGWPMLGDVGTPGAWACARAVADLGSPAGEAVSVQAAPWDLPGAARRFLRASRPRAAVFIETELWPNLLAAAARERLPCVLVSARLSARSLNRYRRFAPGLMRDTVRTFTAIGAQGEEDRDRFIALGAEPASVALTGNLKFDLSVEGAIPARGAVLRRLWAPGRPLWVAGSTHPGEEASCIAAHAALVRRARASGVTPPLLAMAPRRPERFAAVAQWLAAQALHVAPTSQGVAPPVDVVLIDEMGVLMDWYAAADVAFVGGSMVPVGGHNLLEPPHWPGQCSQGRISSTRRKWQRSCCRPAGW